MSNQNLIEYIKMLPEDVKIKTKEKYIQSKIVEAKKKKNISFFDWDGLPKEIQDMIMGYKYEIDKEYIIDIIRPIKINYLEDWMMYKKNSNDEKLLMCPRAKWYDWADILANIINKKDWCSKPIHQKNYDDWLGDDDAPSLTSLIEYYQEEKKKEEKDKNKEIDKVESKFKIGTIIRAKYTDSIFKILSDTKTQFRVKKLECRYDYEHWDDDESHIDNIKPFRVENQETGIWEDGNKVFWIKHKNLSKKQFANGYFEIIQPRHMTFAKPEYMVKLSNKFIEPSD